MPKYSKHILGLRYSKRITEGILSKEYFINDSCIVRADGKFFDNEEIVFLKLKGVTISDYIYRIKQSN